MIKRRLFQSIIFIFIVLTMGCSNDSGGFAPSGDAPPTTPPTDPGTTVNYDYNFKQGETITTAGGWEASIDTTDSTEELTLANGWVIEVKYE